MLWRMLFSEVTQIPLGLNCVGRTNLPLRHRRPNCWFVPSAGPSRPTFKFKSLSDTCGSFALCIDEVGGIDFFGGVARPRSQAPYITHTQAQTEQARSKG